MIPQKINALFEFIDFLESKKVELIRYIPLCNELEKLDKERSVLKPYDNYKDKQRYENIQIEIKEKFSPITENIYEPVTNKMLELKIWSGDDVYSSIWNNNISEISEFKTNFTDEDTEQVFLYKKKYLNFRRETNNDFLCLGFIFSSLDDIMKVLFDFFKNTEENEFDDFETKTIEIDNVAEIIKNFRENKRVRYHIPTDEILKTKKERTEKVTKIKQKITMGDKIKVGNISNNSAPISIGKKNKSKVNGKDEFSKKTFYWQKWGIIIGTVIGIIAIIVAIIYS